MLNRKSFIVLLAILAVLGLCGISHAERASAVWVYLENGHAYQRYDEAVPWGQAKAACAARDGYLATATSQGENAFIFSFVSNLVHGSGDLAWLGATDETAKGTWVWETNEPWGPYQNWAQGQPSDQGFLAMDAYGGQWGAFGGPSETGHPNYVTVDMYVCEWDAPPNLATVPTVTGLTDAAARSAITAAGLAVGGVTTATSATVPSGSVISQNPAAGTIVASGYAVNLVESSGPLQVSVPTVTGLSDAAARSAITAAGLAVGNVTTASSPTVPSGSVISQNPAPGASVNPGSAVNLVESSGPPLAISTDVTNLTVPEGRTGQIHVKLDQQPPSDVVVSASIVTGDPDIYIFSGQTLTFTSSNWATYQPVKVAALPDEDMVNDPATLRLTSDGMAPVEVPVTEIDGGSCPSLFALPDVNGNGEPDLAELHFNPANSTYSILVRDGKTRKLISGISINAYYLPVSVAVLSAGGTCTLAVLERQVNTGSVRCEMIDAFTGNRGTPVAFNAAYVPKALAVLPDMNGNGSTELAVLGAGTDGSASAEIRDSLTGALIQTVPFGKLRPYAFCGIPGLTANSSGLAFVYKNQIGSFAAMIRDAVNSKFVRTLTLTSDYTPTAMKLIPDLNGNSSAEIAVLGFEAPANRAAIQVRDTLTGVQVRLASFSLLRTSSFVKIPDMNGNGLPELGVLGTGINGGSRIEIREPLTGAFIRLIGSPGISTPRGLALLPDLNGTGISALAVLRLNKSTGASSIEIRDSKTGLLIQPLP